jgi:hypothetical protein
MNEQANTSEEFNKLFTKLVLYVGLASYKIGEGLDDPQVEAAAMKAEDALRAYVAKLEAKASA